MKKVILPLLIILTAIPITAQKKLTLDKAISIALDRNTALIKTRNNLESNYSQLKNAYGELLPSFGLQAQWNWQRVNDVGGTQRDFFGNVVEIPPSQTDSRYYSVGMGGNLVLFDGLANVSNIYQKKYNLKAAEYNLEKVKQNVVYETTDYFYQVLNARELMKVREENVKYYEKLYETVNEKNKLGSVAKADVYTAQVQLGNAELQLIQARNTYETALSNFLNYLGLDVLEDYDLVDPFEGMKSIDTDFYMKDFDDIETMVNYALENRYDYKSLEFNLSSARKGLNIARSGLFPTLSANYSWSTSSVDVNKLFDRKVFYVGATLSIPIFSNWSTENQIQLAEVNLKNVNEDLNALERQIKIEIKQGYLDLTAAKKSLDVATKNVLAAEENRKLNQERYNLGAGTILDVLQADRDYIDAVRSKINALYDFYTKYDKLQNSLGKLDYKKFE
ncbi:TolC family protein [Melioribacter sp. Ez-97]|uniref:TolC family protein n=1 Tax=Melioribacter sp. Ez-97 TaxID=3423434 RepID=UPI003ED920B4